ncbi:MAG: hypothetical protein ACK566_06605 [Bacteroidota bacterium]
MIRHTNSSFERLSLVSIVIVFAAVTCFYPWNKKVNVIVWDDFGYYLVLPQTFIYHDPGNADYDALFKLYKKVNPSTTLYQVHQAPNGNHISQYPLGMAIMHLPAFAVGHLFSIFSNRYDADGFSAPYQWSMLLFHFVYVLAGLWYMRKVLLQLFTDRIAALLILLIGLGTNYYWAAHSAPLMSHVYLFFLQAAFVHQVISWHRVPSLHHMLKMGFLLGLMTLCRFTEVTLLLIPVIWNVSSMHTLQEKWNLLKAYKKQIYWAAFLFLLLIGVQLLYWKIYAGEFFYYAYRNAGEGFDFLQPHTLNFLFSFRKGWFIYTPLMLFTVSGFFIFYRNNKLLFWPIFIYTIVNVYVVSSWSNWWYAASFSQRAMIQSYVLLAVPLGYFLSIIASKNLTVRVFFIMLFLSLVALNLFQTWQAAKWILHPSRNTMAYYFKVFGKTDFIPDADEYLLVNRSLENPDVFTDRERYDTCLALHFSFDNAQHPFGQKHVKEAVGLNGSKGLLINDTMPFSEAYTIPFHELTRNTDHAWITIRFKCITPGDVKTVEPVAVLSLLNRKNESYDYRGVECSKSHYSMQTNQWTTIEYTYMTPEVRSDNDPLQLYFWLKGKGHYFVDYLEIYSFVRKNHAR